MKLKKTLVFRLIASLAFGLTCSFVACQRTIGENEKWKVESSFKSNKNSTKTETFHGIDSLHQHEYMNEKVILKETLIGQGAILLMEEDFEKGSIEDVGMCSGNCPEIVSEKTKGNKFMRATLSQDMEVPYRSEISFSQRTAFWPDSLVYLIKFQVRFYLDSDTGFPPSIFVQLHARSQYEKSETELWLPFVGKLREGGDGAIWLAESINGKDQRKRFSFEHEKWYDCSALIRLSTKSHGQISVYRNGVREFHTFGANSNHWKHSSYLKMGIYSGQLRPKHGRSTKARRMVDFDNIKVYDITGLCPLSNKVCAPPI
jgi:hypothetical protein